MSPPFSREENSFLLLAHMYTLPGIRVVPALSYLFLLSIMVFK